MRRTLVSFGIGPLLVGTVTMFVMSPPYVGIGEAIFGAMLITIGLWPKRS